MYISSVVIKNFRGLDIKLDDLQNNFLIIGKNDSGKTNFCYAIRKVIDPLIRRYPLQLSDSTNSNGKNIEIEITINVNEISIGNKNQLGSLIEDDGDDQILFLKLIGTYNTDLGCYDEELSCGKIEENKLQLITNKVDKVIDLIYIPPLYDSSYDKRNFFKSKRDQYLQTIVAPGVGKAIDSLNEEISQDESVKEMMADLQSNGADIVFDGVKFKIEADIDCKNIYRSLDIVATDDENKIYQIGDGKLKTLSLVLNNLMHNSEKEKIFIIEEPENHLYPLLQKYYLSITSKFKCGQTIYTSHSPFIIDFEKLNQIVKLTRVHDDKHLVTKSLSTKFDNSVFINFGFLINQELAEMFFMDTVLLVEGYSEKYFYNLLFMQDEKFRKYVTKNNVGIYCVGGIAFAKIKEILSNLGIHVLIKTDNDIFQKRHYYAGLKRCFNCLDEESKQEIFKLIGNSETLFDCDEGTLKNAKIEENIDRIIAIYEKNDVFISKHNDGFERDFVDFINCAKKDEVIKDLKEAKLKNLHTFIQEESITLKIDDSNVDNSLVKFVK